MSAILNKEISLLIEILERAYNKSSWHGTNLRGSIRGLNITQLSRRPAPKRHNCWELVIHAAYWKYVVYRRLTGSEKGEFPRMPSNWPKMPAKADLKSWREDLALLEKYHKLLLEAVRKFPAKKLDSRPASSKVPYKQIIYGVAAHDLYHAGQIQLLKRLIKTEKEIKNRNK